jgi:DNA-directed RNA polymerase specialized sigma24 family protein
LFSTIHLIPAKHERIDAELRNWGRWTRGRSGGSGATSPMFRMFRASHARSVYGTPTAAPPVRSLDAELLDDVVRELPELHRKVLRGWYADEARPHQIARVLKVKPDTMHVVLHDARCLAAEYLALRQPPARLTSCPTVMFTGAQLEVLA